MVGCGTACGEFSRDLAMLGNSAILDHHELAMNANSSCNVCGTRFGSPFLPGPSDIADLQNMLRSNTLPIETSSFQRTILAAPAELLRYDGEIERLRNTLVLLTADRDSLASYADSCRSALAPIRRLPTELLAEIFDMCEPSADYKESHSGEMDRLSKRYLLQLSQVNNNIITALPLLIAFCV